jgi:hypothetical protein
MAPKTLFLAPEGSFGKIHCSALREPRGGGICPLGRGGLVLVLVGVSGFGLSWAGGGGDSTGVHGP